MKVLITGCNGQVGHSLVKLLTDKVELLAVDKKELDITDKQAVINAVSDFSPDYIINAAAYTAVDKAEEEVELSFKVNRDGPKHLAEVAESCGAVILHISTDYVFNGNSQEAYIESDPADPQNIYGESKHAGEQAVINGCKRHVILRTAWVFSEYGNNFVKTMLRLATDREQLNIVVDQIGGPTYAEDIAKALITIIGHVEIYNDPRWGVYHFSGTPYVSWYEFAATIFEQAEKTHVLERIPVLNAVPTSEFPTLTKRPSNSRLNCDKIAREFGISQSDWKKALVNIQGYKESNESN